ncbi:hypothetical protein [Burkholderia sp. Bp8986]|uniref:hypothetical protein n=1 Tax=Burkholderia sp. Bp8986 TaxID=2184550 RepID=UPI000F5B2849|nr:hypothetical protein [Burkholderia sp. Bp8986]
MKRNTKDRAREYFPGTVPVWNKTANVASACLKITNIGALTYFAMQVREIGGGLSFLKADAARQ